MAFIGLGRYAGIASNLIYASNKTDTEDEIRKGYVAVLKMGLIPYVARTPIRDLLDDRVQGKAQADRRRGPLEILGLQPERGRRIRPGIPGRIPIAVLQRLGQQNHSRTQDPAGTFDVISTGMSSNTRRRRIDSDSESVDFAGLFVKSLGEHWSAGI